MIRELPLQLNIDRWALLLATMLACGCGTTLSRSATEQLLTSDAVDRTVGSLNFRDLTGRKVYLDTQFIRHIKGVGFVNAEYIISSLRQQLISARCWLQDKPEDAEFIVEARVGALGADRHEIVYGLPASNGLDTAASLVPTLPSMPPLPELSVAKKNESLGAAKIAVYAYHRETGQPLWQSGIVTSRSTAKQTWVFGAGPFQRGTIYEGTEFAGSTLGILPLFRGENEKSEPEISYRDEYHFPPPVREEAVDESQAENAAPDGEAVENSEGTGENKTEKDDKDDKREEAEHDNERNSSEPVETAGHAADEESDPQPADLQDMETASDRQDGEFGETRPEDGEDGQAANNSTAPETFEAPRHQLSMPIQSFEQLQWNFRWTRSLSFDDALREPPLLEDVVPHWLSSEAFRD